MFLTDKINFDNLGLHYDELLDYNLYDKSVDKIDINQFKNKSYEETINILKQNSSIKYMNLPHLILYGNNNFEILKLINNLLEKIYDKDIYNIELIPYTIYGYGTTKNIVNIKQSKYHIIIEPNSNGFDKYIIHEIIKQYAETYLLNISDKKNKFRTVIINKIDDLSIIAQTSLRRTMEKHIDSCKFIFVSEQISNIIEPLRSRCLSLRIKPLTEYKIFKILLELLLKEKIDFYPPLLLEIIKISNNSLKKSIWILELFINNISYNENWKCIINKIIDKIFLIVYKSNKNNYITYFSKIRKYLYLIFITNIDTKQMITQIMESILFLIDNIDIKYKLIEETSIYDNRLRLGKRHILHLEAYINSIIKILYDNKDLLNYEEILNKKKLISKYVFVV